MATFSPALPMTLLAVLLTAQASGTAAVVTQLHGPDAQSLPTTPTEFQLANRATRGNVLRAIAIRSVPVSNGQTNQMLDIALQDTDPLLRRQACEAITALGWSGRMNRDAVTARRWRDQERPVLVSVEPRLLELVRTDPDERVRRAALIAAGNLDAQPDVSDKSAVGRVRISDPFADFLASAYSNEQSTSVRAEIIRALSAARSDSPRRVQALRAALGDVAPIVVQYAVLGIGDAKVESALPDVVSILESHSSVRVRVAAAQAVAMFGASAASYLSRLRDALAREPDEITRRTIAGTIAVVERGK